MVCKGLKLLKFEIEVGEALMHLVTLSGESLEEKEETRRYVITKIAEERKDNKNIYIVGVSDLGYLNLISPKVEKIFRDFFDVANRDSLNKKETSDLTMKKEKKTRKRRQK